jgi:hypothetical protein
MHSLHSPHDSKTRKHPIELRVRSYIGGIVDYKTFGIGSTGKKQFEGIHYILLQLSSIMQSGKGMHNSGKKEYLSIRKLL